ncbi:venom protein 302-like [Styela clava]|uniref:venom protein 302-like n=1 Tax=Styela clava TaxID=7725 RepID=UPI001939CE91|nr:venom protein 302-like [Styela clava]
MLIKILLICAGIMHACNASSCRRCKQKKCKKLTECMGSIIKDNCRCCDVCAKQEGELCGGLWNLQGACDSHMKCHKEKPETITTEDGKIMPLYDPWYFQKPGICRKTIS